MILSYYMNTNIQVNKNDKENTAGLLRRFSKRVRGSGILSKVKSLRYYERQKSEYVRKKKTLKRLVKKAKRDEMIKLGKIIEPINKFEKR